MAELSTTYNKKLLTYFPLVVIYRNKWLHKLFLNVFIYRNKWLHILFLMQSFTEINDHKEFYKYTYFFTVVIYEKIWSYSISKKKC